MLTILLRFIKRPLVYCILFFLEDKQFLATRILVLATKNENLEATWPQDFFLKVKPWHVKWTKILCISIVSVKGCTALIMAIKLNKVTIKPEKNICYLLQSATECLAQEIWRNVPWFAPLAFTIVSVASQFFPVLCRDCFGQHRYTPYVYIFERALRWRGNATINKAQMQTKYSDVINFYSIIAGYCCSLDPPCFHHVCFVTNYFIVLISVGVRKECSVMTRSKWSTSAGTFVFDL